MIFEQRDVEIPADWSQTATNIVASKYFHGKVGSPDRERSVAQLVHRVVDTIADWGKSQGYFQTRRGRRELPQRTRAPDADPEGLLQLAGLVQCRRQRIARLRLVLRRRPTAITKTERRGDDGRSARRASSTPSTDSLESILELAKTEGMLFKWGSGTGTNLSTLREEDAILSGGGRASGPLSFMKGFDAFAGVIKSGGKTRRAAKMVILNADHPDIEKFIWCKAKEEKKAHTLIDAGYDSSLDGEAYSSIFFQNANNSVRATDEFMQAVVEDRDWWTKSRVTDQPVKRYKARDLLQQIAEATLAVRRPGHAVRYHGQPLAHVEEHGAHQCFESVLGVHVPRRFGLQPGVAEPDEVRRARRPIRCRSVPARRGYCDRGAGDHRR